MNAARMVSLSLEAGLAVRLLVGLGIGLHVATAAGAEGGRWVQHRLPVPGKPLAGFTCDVRMIDPENYGYLPVQLTATATTGRFPADRRVTVELIPTAGANWPQPQTDYQFALELPEGQARVTATHHLPKYFVGASFDIRLSEGGRELDGYRLRHHSGHGDRWLMAASLERTVRYALILPDASVNSTEPWARVPDLRTISSMDIPNIPFLMSWDERLSDADALANLRTSPTPVRQVMRASEAHTSWLGYESSDVVIVGFGVLERMRDEHPERFKALRDWVACGGAVWTFGVANRQALAELLGTTPVTAGDPSVAEEIRTALQGFATGRVLPQDDWFLQQIQDQERTEAELKYMDQPPPERWREWTADRHPVAELLAVKELEQALYPQPLMAGLVVGFRDPDPFPGAFQLWHIAKHFTAARQVWPLKHGTTVLSGSDHFWDWSLENVARPPVYAFLGVLTGFVLLVGPISYRFTRYHQRTYLMFLIAPVLATVATLMLFGYGVLADGLGTQVRIRQITWADGASTRAARMTRATYFAGFRPEDGVRFPRDASVYPVFNLEEGEAKAISEAPKRDQSVLLSDDYQRLKGEFMPARRQRQFLATRPIEDAGAITLSQLPGQPPSLRNDFDLEIYELVARDFDGNYFTTTGPISAGSVAQGRAIGSGQATTLLRKMYRVETPQPPPGYQPSGMGGMFASNYYYQWGGSPLQNQNVSWSNPSMELGIFEARLGTLLSERASIPSGWFVGRAALAEDAVAVEGAEPVSSVHFIIGALR